MFSHFRNMWKLASRLMQTKNGCIVFAFGFSFYLFMKYYLVSVAVGSGDERDSRLLSVANGMAESTPVPNYATVKIVNSSFDALFGNASCRADVLGAPPYVRAAGCNHGECETITCQRLLVGDKDTIAAAIKFTSQHKRNVRSETEVLKNAANCDEFRRRGGYRDTPVRPSDSEFPIAFSILVHWHLEQFERLLRAIYRPQNVYCVHVDAKTSWTFHSAVARMASCLDNVYIATRRQHVVYAGFSRLQVQHALVIKWFPH